MELKGSKTEENLWAAFAGESKARNKYTYYASVARKEGYEQIANIFLETAENEKEHARVHFKHLSGIGTTLENLKDAEKGEHYEQTEMYPEFARIAREEGFHEIADSFENIALAEVAHENRYIKLQDNIKQNKVFEKDQETEWKCGNCGYVLTGKSAPDVCPACKHPRKHFQLKNNNY
ncbi:MAG: rubrerythrin family protein [bacterium]|nr:rubrerythrin family protein [bacterium]